MRLAVWCLFLGLPVICADVQAETAFYYASSPDSWVGGGETRFVTPRSGYSFSRTYNGNAVYTFIDNVSSPTPGNWYLGFIGADATQLSVGDYFNAERMILPPPGHAPGMDFSGNFRDNNMLTGEFHVLELKYGGPTGIQSFAVDFMQYDEGVTNWWNWGSYRFNSDIPITLVPEPRSLELCTLCLCAILGRRGLRPGRG
jgi:hypothetical protein